MKKGKSGKEKSLTPGTMEPDRVVPVNRVVEAANRTTEATTTIPPRVATKHKNLIW
jgi:hypothetical protein